MRSSGVPDPGTALLLFLAVLAAVWALWRILPGLRRHWHRRGAGRTLREDALKHVYVTRIEGGEPTLAGLAGALEIGPDSATVLVGSLVAAHLLDLAEGSLRLTETGRAQARHLVRAHRLWERHLADETGYGEAEWHRRADQAEHRMSPEAVGRLAAHLGHPTRDPHGDPIPGPHDDPDAPEQLPLMALRPGQSARIVHVEDEPEAAYAPLVAAGLVPGMHVQLRKISSRGVTLVADGVGLDIPVIAAGNVAVETLGAWERPSDSDAVSLASLRPGERARVVRISPRCRGLERHRLTDLGVLPGTEIRAELEGAAGDPTAYRIRNTLIAFRTEQAEYIRVVREGGGDA